MGDDNGFVRPLLLKGTVYNKERGDGRGWERIIDLSDAFFLKEQFTIKRGGIEGDGRG
jgi:hypothetical protein